MAIDASAIGRSGTPTRVEWTADDIQLYALACGAGQDDPMAELDLTTENSAGVALRPLPAFAAVLAQRAGRRGALPSPGEIDRVGLVHAEQHLVVHRPLPVAGALTFTGRIAAIHDKSPNAVVVNLLDGVDDDGAIVVTSTASLFIHGAGGFGGSRGTSERPLPPVRPPDAQFEMRTRTDQALLYRLTGDRNPLHSDPSYAARAGFARPILHGMCTYGITARVLERECGGSLTSLSARFSAPVVPGDSLTLAIWRSADSSSVQFTVACPDGVVVMNSGRAQFTSPGA